MNFNIEFQKMDNNICVDFEKIEGDINVFFDEGFFGKVYEGEYEVIPTFENQELDTSGVFLEKNVEVKPIPVLRVSNESGGQTVIIGG